MSNRTINLTEFIVRTTGSALHKAILRDPETRARILSLPTLDARIHAAVAVGRELGLDVGEAEVRDLLVPPSRELSDAELSAVTGGKDGCNLVGDDGDNRFDGGLGDDTLTGGDGDDTLWSIFGDNQEFGGDGDDKLITGDGHDTLFGEDGDDTMKSGFEEDYLDGGDGDDFLDGGNGDDTMLGGDGDDIMYGDDSNPMHFFGLDGEDSMDGGDGNDQMFGQVGDDTLDGGAGNDTLDGGSGNDILTGGDGNDVLSGGEGGDLFVFDHSDGQDVVTDFHPGEDQLSFTGIENAGQLGVSVQDGNTIITYGDTTVTLQGVEMTADQVWGSVQHD